MDANYFQALTNFIIRNNHLLHNSKLYFPKKGIPQFDCSSSLLANLYLRHFEHKFKNNNALIFRYIDDIILISSYNVTCF